MRRVGVAAVILLLVLLGGTARATPSDAARPVSGRCPVPVLSVFMTPPGRLTVFAYQLASGGVMENTHVVLATADARGGAVSLACARVPSVAPPRVVRNLAGPWPRTVESRMSCGSSRGPLVVQVRPLRRLGRAVGTRLLVQRDRVVLVDAFLTRRGGGISYDPDACGRNVWP